MLIISIYMGHVCVFQTNLPSIAEVIWRGGWGHPLVSSQKLEKPEIRPQPLVFKGEWFIHCTTPAPIYIFQNENGL